VGEHNRRLKNIYNEKPYCLYTYLNVVRAIRPEKKDDIFGEYVDDNNIINIKRI